MASRKTCSGPDSSAVPTGACRSRLFRSLSAAAWMRKALIWAWANAEMVRDLGQVIAIAVVERQPRAQPEHDDVGGALSPRRRDGNDEQRRRGLGPRRHRGARRRRRTGRTSARGSRSPNGEGPIRARTIASTVAGSVSPAATHEPERARPDVVAVDERERNVVTRVLQRIDRGVQHHGGIGGQRGPLGERTHGSIPPGDDHLGGRLGDRPPARRRRHPGRRGPASSRTSSRPLRGARCGTPAPAGPRSSSTARGSSRRRSGARRSARSPASSPGRADPWRPGACPRRSWAGRRRCRPGSARGPTRGTSGDATAG